MAIDTFNKDNNWYEIVKDMPKGEIIAHHQRAMDRCIMHQYEAYNAVTNSIEYQADIDAIMAKKAFHAITDAIVEINGAYRTYSTKKWGKYAKAIQHAADEAAKKYEAEFDAYFDMCQDWEDDDSAFKAGKHKSIN